MGMESKKWRVLIGDELPIELTGAVVEQLMESSADGGFVIDAEFFELGKAGVVCRYRFVRWLEFQGRHGSGE
jgi:hypothetical protein